MLGNNLSLQLWPFSYIGLLKMLYENEVTLKGQNIPLKCCQILKLLIYIEKGLTFFYKVKGLQNCHPLNFENDFGPIWSRNWATRAYTHFCFNSLFETSNFDY